MTLEKVDLVTTVFIMIIDIGFYEVGVIFLQASIENDAL
jgi:hypothetical protein